MSRHLTLVVLIAACDAGVKPTPASPPPSPAAPIAPRPPPAAHEHVLLASIDRGMCYGTCPAYTFTVYRDGKVEYVGKNFVKTKGKADGTLTDAQLAALDKLFIDGKYADYKSSYEAYDVTDNPSAKTAYQPVGAKTPKTVAHYYGDMHAPQSLTELEAKFDEIVQIDRWIGTDKERESD
jgi:Domain of unknown function (DUF6438)